MGYLRFYRRKQTFPGLRLNFSKREVHLAAALSLGKDLGAVITYDLGLAAAARHHKLEVLSPN
jgi:predicted nucleic acid-binding protein